MATAVATEAPASRKECFGVFCTTYDLKAEDKTKSWKKLVNVAVSGAAGMISNHLLFKVTNLFIDSACFLSTRDALLYC